MNTVIVHLSDLHYRQNWIESQGVVLDAFFKNLSQQIEQLGKSNIYIAFSGDLVYAGDSPNIYEEFITHFDSKLNDLNIPKCHRICVPGNHDVSIKQIESRIVEHEGVVCQRLDERQFCDYVSNKSNIFSDKFLQYRAFEPHFADYGALSSTSGGAGWEIADGIGVYCLNSALCCSGGLKGKDGKNLVDKGRLSIDTRSIHSWNQKCKARNKILIMHHPINWLTEWAEKELRTILRKDFALCLSGHDHDQSSFHTINKGLSLVECSAPPLFTSKTGDLGYSIISVCPDKGVSSIAYRQWTKYQSFVAGVSFSNTDDGRIIITEPAKPPESININKPRQNGEANFLDRYLTKRLDDALVSFSSQPKVWVEPSLCKSAEIAKDAGSAEKIDLSEFISNPKSTIIKAPPQFGLTCLALYLTREAWRSPKSALWIYLDSTNLKSNPASIEQAIVSELQLLGGVANDIKCVILDSWISYEKDSQKLLQKVCDRFKGVPVIVMQTFNSSQFLTYSEKDTFDREFEVLFLWALPRGHVRKVVSDYNETRHIGDEDKVTTKVVSDLEVLNLHRTPFNCLTLLKISEAGFDESPVNRSEMIKKILNLLFNVDDIPTYKVRPDLKDSEYVLGYFCETMLRESNYSFTREHFLNLLERCCTERFIDLEVQVVFDVLYKNNILIRRGNSFCFRFAFWIYYFAAQRMHHNPNFANFIYEDMRYTKYPEIMEFYTGIDRQREDALQVLIKDIRATCDKVQEKCGIPEGLNPYRFAQWNPSDALLVQMQNEINNGVIESNLPASVKDHYADRQYDRSRPYDQDIRSILAEYSYVYMVQAMIAGARALRNSDYAEPETKHQLLTEIMRCWQQVSKVLLILTPILAERGSASFDGQGFLLIGDFGDTPEQRLYGILNELPANVVHWFQEDLFSQKMGPLLIEQFANDTNDISRHELIMMLTNQRPRGWKAQVQNYISSVSKNSFYLWDIYRSLRTQYRFGYASSRTLSDIEFLIKMAAAKHLTGSKSPGTKLINKIKDAIPVREVEGTEIL